MRKGAHTQESPFCCCALLGGGIRSSFLFTTVTPRAVALGGAQGRAHTGEQCLLSAHFMGALASGISGCRVELTAPAGVSPGRADGGGASGRCRGCRVRGARGRVGRRGGGGPPEWGLLRRRGQLRCGRRSSLRPLRGGGRRSHGALLPVRPPIKYNSPFFFCRTAGAPPLP